MGDLDVRDHGPEARYTASEPRYIEHDIPEYSKIAMQKQKHTLDELYTGSATDSGLSSMSSGGFFDDEEDSRAVYSEVDFESSGSTAARSGDSDNVYMGMTLPTIDEQGHMEDTTYMDGYMVDETVKEIEAGYLGNSQTADDYLSGYTPGSEAMSSAGSCHTKDPYYDGYRVEGGSGYPESCV